MGKKITVTLWEDTWEAVQAMQKAHDEWLLLAQQSGYDHPALPDLPPWTVADVVNSVLRQYCPVEAARYRHSTELLKREKAELAEYMAREERSNP